MSVRLLLSLTVAVFVGLVGSAHATTGWAVQSGVNDGLYRIDLETGEETAVGSGVGFFQTRSLAFDAQGRLFAVDSGVDQLIQINLGTGVGTPVGSTIEGTVHSLEFDCAGRLLMVANPAGTHNLYTVDPASGAGTLVGPTGMTVAGLASTQNTVFALTGAGASVGLGTVDPATGGVAPIGLTGQMDLQAGGLAADSSGALWAISPDPAGNIYGVNSSTGAAVLQGAVNAANGSGFGGLAIDAPSRCGPPTVTVTSGPQGLTNDSTPTFSFSVAVPGASLQCGFDSALAPCGGQTATSAPLADGAHSFRAVALARDGVSASATRAFTVDTKPPKTRLTRHPKRRTHARTVKFKFSSSERSTFRCKLDRRRWSRCRSPRTYRHLRPGRHRFRVAATDRAGNKDATPARYTFRVLA